MTTIINQQCACPPGSCAHFVEPDTDCVGRLHGLVVTLQCDVCNPDSPTAATWHEDGQCVKCRHKEKTSDPH